MVVALLIAGVLVMWIWNADPLMVLVVAIMLFKLSERQDRKQAISTFEYWKAEEIDLKQRIREAKDDDKDRRVRVREARAERKRKVVHRSKELRLFDKIFTPENRTMLKATSPEARAAVAKQVGIKPETLEAWIVLEEAELHRRKMGISDEVD